jgi:hypothetical protein
VHVYIYVYIYVCIYIYISYISAVAILAQAMLKLNPDCIDVAAHIGSLAQAGNTLSKAEIDACARAAEIAKQVMTSTATSLVLHAQHRPLLRSSSCDGTPMRVRKVIRLDPLPGSGGSRIVKGASEAHEFLVTASFIRFIDSLGVCVTKAWLTYPLPLTKGKRVPAIVASALRVWRSLRQLGHRGPCVEHYAFDRCGFASLQRHFNEWHEEPASPPNAIINVIYIRIGYIQVLH